MRSCSLAHPACTMRRAPSRTPPPGGTCRMRLAPSRHSRSGDRSCGVCGACGTTTRVTRMGWAAVVRFARAREDAINDPRHQPPGPGCIMRRLARRPSIPPPLTPPRCRPRTGTARCPNPTRQNPGRRDTSTPPWLCCCGGSPAGTRACGFHCSCVMPTLSEQRSRHVQGSQVERSAAAVQWRSARYECSALIGPRSSTSPPCEWNGSM